MDYDYPTLWRWKAATTSRLPRSRQLQNLDAAIHQYEFDKSDDNLWNIKRAFDEWKRYCGRGFTTSVDQLTAMETLGRMLSKDPRLDARIYQITHFTLDDLKRLAYWAGERKKVIQKTFEGKQVTFRNTPAGAEQAVKEAAKKVKDTCTEAKAWITGLGKKSPPTGAGSQPFAPSKIGMTEAKLKNKLEEMAKKLFQVKNLGTLGTITELITNEIVGAVPVVEYIKDGYELFTEWANVGSSLHEQYSISSKSYAIDTDKPAAAFEALKTCLKEETKREVESASTATTSFALKTGLTFVDGGTISGPAVGILKALATLALQLYWLATEWKATRGINDALNAGKLDIRLFETYPLMGCYMLTSATLSDLIPINYFGTPGWMEYAQKLKKQGFDAIYESAHSLIDKSPWEIKGLPKRSVKGAGLQIGMVTGLGSGAYKLGSNSEELYDQVFS